MMANTEILVALDRMLHYRMVIDGIYLFMAIALIVIAILLVGKKALASIALFLLAACITALAATDFVPVYRDHTQQTYVTEKESTILVGDSTLSGIESYHTVVLTTSDGESIELKLTDSGPVSTGCQYSGTFVYTQHARELIWFRLDSGEE